MTISRQLHYFLYSDDEDEISPGTWNEYPTSKQSSRIGTRMIKCDQGGTSNNRGAGVVTSTGYHKERGSARLSRGMAGSDGGKWQWPLRPAGLRFGQTVGCLPQIPWRWRGICTFAVAVVK